MPRVKTERPTIKCAVCGKGFRQWNPQKLYCSKRCRLKAHYRAQKSKLAEVEKWKAAYEALKNEQRR